ncbi:hypothetical protein DPMN_056197 [Dreissena polymorpha]|uniref:Uncharacterized protein n=1 Tax=Dreissena polymorpha TaxID=45954 RepID=A0A9D4CSS3_DREPO|nr:hypothetical protein DPMN_056197 [Dreissena polymorpha]
MQYGLILCTAIELLLITLQFQAKSEFYSEGGMTHGVSRSSVCKSISQKTALVVTVCAKLHNLCVSDGFLDIDDIVAEDNDDNAQLPMENPDQNALRVRALLIESFH